MLEENDEIEKDIQEVEEELEIDEDEYDYYCDGVIHRW